MNAVRSLDSSQVLECRVITDLAAWSELEPVWDRLLHASPDRTPWQNFAFLTAWWAHLSDDMPLRIVVVERRGVPCLVLPLQIASWKRIPGLPVRLLEPVSMIMDVNRPRLGLGAFDEHTYRCAFEAIWNLRHEWDLLRIDEKPWDDSEVAVLRNYALERGCVFRQTFSHLVPYLDLRQRWDDYLGGRSQKMRKNLKAARRKLEAMGLVELRKYETTEEVRCGFAVYLDLHARSWKRQRKVEHSKSPGYRAFFEQWVNAMARQNACQVLALYCNGEPAAATIAFTDADTYYSAQIVHDAKYAACSPGTLLESMELEMLINQGRFTRYEFLGSFLNNKLRWTDTATNTALALVYQRSLRTFVMDGYYSLLKPYLRPALIALRQRFFPRNKGATHA